MDQNQPYIFKPRRINKRLLFLKKRLEENMIIDHIGKKIIIINDLRYFECLILEKHYQGYIIDVKGFINLNRCSLNKLPRILFNKVTGYFSCAFNNITSLEYSPKEIGQGFHVNSNKIESLEGCPKRIKKYFFINNNTKDFTIEEIKEHCKVEGDIVVKT
jgi:hypothetical protein